MSIGISESWKDCEDYISTDTKMCRLMAKTMFNSTYGINPISPSKKFAKIGEALGEDFSKGIKKASESMMTPAKVTYPASTQMEIDNAKRWCDISSEERKSMFERCVMGNFEYEMHEFQKSLDSIAKYVDDEKEKEKMEKRCTTCKYQFMYSPRCKGCHTLNGRANWEPKEEMKKLNPHDVANGKVTVKIHDKTYLPRTVTIDSSAAVYPTYHLEVNAGDYIRTYGDDNPEIKDVIFNPPATVVFWKDGTKTVVKAEGEAFDPEKGLAMAFSKKFLGNKYEYYNTFKHWLKKAPGYKKEK